MPKTEMDRSGTIIIKICIFSIILSITALFLSFVFHKWIYIDETTNTLQKNNTVIILDAGHGGEDSGAVGVDGSKEKDINLNIALSVGDILKSAGYTVIQTRIEDELLYSNKEKGSLKMQDLSARLKICNETDNCIFISLHANKFSQEKYNGLQTFYSTNDEKSKFLALKIQNNVKEYLQNENDREIKVATSAIFLLNNAKNPAVLVECGFLSNKEECAKLNDETYRKELACLISKSVIEFLEET